MVKFKNLENHRHEQARWTIKDRGAWNLKVDGRELLPQRLLDLSGGGLAIQVGALGCWKVGDSVEVKLKLYSKYVVNAKALVRWTRPSNHSLNMQVVGLELQNPINGVRPTNLRHVVPATHRSLKLPKLNQPISKRYWSLWEYSLLGIALTLAGFLIKFVL